MVVINQTRNIVRYLLILLFQIPEKFIISYLSEKSTKFMKFLFAFTRILQQGQSKTVHKFENKNPYQANIFLDRDPRTFCKKSGADTPWADFKDIKPLRDQMTIFYEISMATRLYQPWRCNLDNFGKFHQWKTHDSHLPLNWNSHHEFVKAILEIVEDYSKPTTPTTKPLRKQ